MCFIIIKFLTILSLHFSAIAANQQVNQSHTCHDYQLASSPFNTSLSPQLPGATRSIVIPSSYALITPESRVYGVSPPGWIGKISAAVVISPPLGAHFTMYMVNAQAASMSKGLKFPNPPNRLERFIYVLSGQLHVKSSKHKLKQLTAGCFVYCAPNDNLIIDVHETSSFIMIDRIYAGNHSPKSFTGSEQHIPVEICDGEVFELRRLFDASDKSFDFNIHIMDFNPGEYLNVKEVHYNQHGLLMLQGHGIYMLGERFMPVTTGDIIFMAPFVPQWYAALGTQKTRYFLYKDTNIDPLLN